MKKFERILLAGFVLSVVFSFLGFSANCERISEKVLRLHVLANSDSEYDQRIKLQVKDEVSAYAGELLESTKTLAEAELVIENSLASIEELANESLAAQHCDYRARAVMEECYFGTREYEDFSLPAGRYKALRVLIGEGAGKNWWCVVYPSLCISAAADFETFSGGEKEIVQHPGDYKVSFKVYEWYHELMNFFGT